MLYLISEEANRDLDEITDYFLSVSVDAGDKFVASFDRKCLYLTQFPRIGKLYPSLGNDLRGIRLERYIVFYRVFPDRLIIVRILNASRDLKAQFFESP
jgi:toxin ParE1/3/4